jgi:hypothetical protein
VQLHRQVEPLPLHLVEERGLLLRILGLSRPGIANAVSDRHGHDAVNGSRPAGQEALMPWGREEHNLSGRVGGAERGQRRDRDDVVADGVCA